MARLDIRVDGQLQVSREVDDAQLRKVLTASEPKSAKKAAPKKASDKDTDPTDDEASGEEPETTPEKSLPSENA